LNNTIVLYYGILFDDDVGFYVIVIFKRPKMCCWLSLIVPGIAIRIVLLKPTCGSQGKQQKQE